MDNTATITSLDNESMDNEPIDKDTIISEARERGAALVGIFHDDHLRGWSGLFRYF